LWKVSAQKEGGGKLIKKGIQLKKEPHSKTSGRKITTRPFFIVSKVTSMVILRPDKEK